MSQELNSVATDLTQGWNWENQHVNDGFNTSGGKPGISPQAIVESGTVLVCAAPATMMAGTSLASASSGIRIVPIGMVEQVSVSQSKPLSRIFEIGSKLSYIIPGRTVGQIALARVLFDGPSLLKCLYQGEVDADAQLANGNKSVRWKSDTDLATGKSSVDANGLQAIGSGNFALNLASSFFDHPVGLVFLFHDRANHEVASMYFEGCQVSTHNIGIAAGMNIITESISMEFVQARPVITGTDATKMLSNVMDPVGSLYDVPIIGSSSALA